jgi:hypothetical protein
MVPRVDCVEMELRPSSRSRKASRHEGHVQMALANPSWRYTRIRGALANLGHQVGLRFQFLDNTTLRRNWYHQKVTESSVPDAQASQLLEEKLCWFC